MLIFTAVLMLWSCAIKAASSPSAASNCGLEGPALPGVSHLQACSILDIEDGHHVRCSVQFSPHCAKSVLAPSKCLSYRLISDLSEAAPYSQSSPLPCSELHLDEGVMVFHAPCLCQHTCLRLQMKPSFRKSCCGGLQASCDGCTCTGRS